MNVFDLAISFALITLVDVVTIEIWLKPLWRMAGWNESARYVQRYQLATFGLWYAATFVIMRDPIGILAQAGFHAAGLEDLLYSLACPIFGRIHQAQENKPTSEWAAYSWQGLETVKFGPFVMPIVWRWLGNHENRILTNYWLALFTSSDGEVHLGGLTASIWAMAAVQLIAWALLS